ncbi:type I methionyl aminopeptidase [Clostridium sp. MSJ-8]|uniref:type I methionyl aminopeptidase n=1 Tax=Clostridium sp. MSJ-8 TaxID=2841510 RepID=UPI001C0EA030|nr:type I methionyl aminopeptidase [Clostridium sp. MSJ-8]MBU5486978.1 type I methionyl aminopeptidase [Clostridium sp. MSJ-8]
MKVNNLYNNLDKDIKDKILYYKKLGHVVPPARLINTPEDIAGIRKSSKINTLVLDTVAANIKEGMSTEEINEIVHNTTISNGAIPAPLNYGGFPKSVCTSINNEVCHGIPNKNIILKDGDIINVDVSTIYEGYYSDASRTFMIGNVPEEVKKLVKVTKECLELGINECKPWGFIGDIGEVIYKHAKENGYTIVREFIGHGVGKKFHDLPDVHHVGKKGTGMLLVPGMTFTIEPMVNMGKRYVKVDPKNGWTVTTKDGLPSAQVEHTILITETGYEILTY